MVNQFSQAASQHLDPIMPSAAGMKISAADRADHNEIRMELPGDSDWQGWHPRHREVGLHPAILIVLVNLGVVALGLTASLGLVSLTDEPSFEVMKAPTEIMPTRSPTPSLPAPSLPATARETPPSSVPDTPPATAVVIQSQENPARSATPPVIHAKIAERTAYILQLGAFADPAGALRMQTNLRKRGYPAVVASSIEGGKTLHVVRIGGFRDRNEAAQTANTLQNQAGLSSIIRKAQHK